MKQEVNVVTKKEAPTQIMFLFFSMNQSIPSAPH